MVWIENPSEQNAFSRTIIPNARWEVARWTILRRNSRIMEYDTLEEPFIYTARWLRQVSRVAKQVIVIHPA
ncbi:hypothetical protein CEP52_000579 [Fusarium oligoseptatum]|uniref:Uncharacterized protein n=2 Tax=Fusarium solani species complex TaxID=232080 RepID=A0A428UP00_9HYPO|nr:hypothetical protein CEP51_010999 [Fusarium floridanum]RSM15943.1 hypothetical protein CEP52_000579 [Fusarium oligoseptatum]